MSRNAHSSAVRKKLGFNSITWQTAGGWDAYNEWFGGMPVDKRRGGKQEAARRRTGGRQGAVKRQTGGKQKVVRRQLADNKPIED